MPKFIISICILTHSRVACIISILKYTYTRKIRFEKRTKSVLTSNIYEIHLRQILDIKTIFLWLSCDKENNFVKYFVIHNIYITYKIVYKSGADSSSRSREITI